jgi:hypothetical protein
VLNETIFRTPRGDWFFASLLFAQAAAGTHPVDHEWLRTNVGLPMLDAMLMNMVAHSIETQWSGGAA